MSEEKARDIEQQALGVFSGSFVRRYEHWKKKNLLSIAFRTMPKQVQKKAAVENLKKLRAEFAEKLAKES